MLWESGTRLWKNFGYHILSLAFMLQEQTIRVCKLGRMGTLSTGTDELEVEKDRAGETSKNCNNQMTIFFSKGEDVELADQLHDWGQ